MEKIRKRAKEREREKGGGEEEGGDKKMECKRKK